MFSRVSMSSLVVAVSLAAAVFGTGCAASGEDTNEGAGAQSVPASTLARSYQGTIGTLKVMARLEAKGTAISGSYFYADKETNGDVIVLSGNAVGTKLTMSEALNGKKTGSFDTSLGNGVINGTWKSADGATSLPIKLTAVKSGTLLAVTRKFADSAPAADPGPSFKTCALTASYIEVFGLDSAAAEAAINKQLAPAKVTRDANGKCDDAGSIDTTQEVAFNANGLLSITTNKDEEHGDYPDTSISYANFKLADGAPLTGKDFFADGALAKIKDLLVKGINADASLAAEDKTQSLASFDMHWASVASVDDLQLGIRDTGIAIEMLNNYAHVDAALAPSETLAWADIKGSLKSGSPILPLVK